MTETTKSLIGKEFRRLQDYNYKVFSFGDNRRGRMGQAGWVDNLIISNKYVVFIETKTQDTKDRLNERQKTTGEILSNLSTINKSLHYRVVRTLPEAKRLVELILEGKL
jgi:hypothetical protein